VRLAVPETPVGRLAVPRSRERRCLNRSDDVHTRVLKPKHGPTLLVRPLRRGDVGTVAAMFERLGEGSRRARFHGAKPRLTDSELAWLARVDADHHVLVAYVEDDRCPVGMARLVRNGQYAEIAFEVADAYQHRGIGTALTAELLADARAAGITEITAHVLSDNPAAVALLRRILQALEIRFEGPQLEIRAALA